MDCEGVEDGEGVVDGAGRRVSEDAVCGSSNGRGRVANSGSGSGGGCRIVSVAASGWGIVLVDASGWGILLVAVAVAAGRAFTDVRGPMAVFSSLVPVSAAACSDPASESVDAAACSDGSSANDDGCGVGRAPTSTTATTASSEGPSVWSEEAVKTSGSVGLATDQVSVAAVSGRFAS